MRLLNKRPMNNNRATVLPVRQPLNDSERDRKNLSLNIGSEATKRCDPGLELDTDAFPESAIYGLIEDWLVPTIVDQLLREVVSGSERNEVR